MSNYLSLSVYDGGSKLGKNRYTLYVPTPASKIVLWGFKGLGLGFSWKNNEIIRCDWFECRNGLNEYNLGRKVDKSNLPNYIRLWVEKMERLYNRAITLNTSSAWDEWYKA